MKTIGDDAFCYCSNLTNVTIGSGVETIGTGAFQECSITSLTIPENVKLIGAEAFSSNDFTSVTIPDAVESIGGYAFGSCSYLTDVTIGRHFSPLTSHL